MASDQKIIADLWRYGYLDEEVKHVELKHPVIVQALAKYQDFCYYPLNDLVRAEHGRDLIVDGDAGPATRRLFEMPRCLVPDVGPESAPSGSGSWPSPCQKSGVKYWINWNGAPTAVRVKSAQLETDWVELWRLVGLRLVRASSSDAANIYVHFRSFFGSTIGLSSFNDRTCSDVVDCAMSNTYVGENLGLLKHETGHNCNLSHTRGGTMNPYILDEPDPHGRWQIIDPSWATVARYFDGVPVGEPAPLLDPIPTPPPPSRPFFEFLKWLFGITGE